MVYALETSQRETHNGKFHLYLVDQNGKKIAAIWGNEAQKLERGYLFSAAPELQDALRTLIGLVQSDENVLRKSGIKDAIKAGADALELSEGKDDPFRKEPTNG